MKGFLDLQVRDECQQLRRVNENKLEGSVSLFLLLESNRPLLTSRAALGLGLTSDLLAHRGSPGCPGEGRGAPGAGAAGSFSPSCAADTCLGVQPRAWPGPVRGGGRVWFLLSFLWTGCETQS